MKEKKEQTTHDSERAIQRRNQVLDAALICFRLHGFHGASMAQISKEAGMSPGHIYHYFQNKEAIISAIVERDAHEMTEWTDSFMASDNMLATMIDEIPSGIEANCCQNTAALMLEIMAESARNPTIASIIKQHKADGRERLLKLLQMEMAQRQGASEQDLMAKVELICAMFDGLLMRATYRSDEDNAKLAELMKKVMHYLLTV